MPNSTLERQDDRLDAAFAALADPTRRAIVDRLARGEATVLELASPFDVSLPAISRHLKVLEQAGLISRSRRGRERPCNLRPETVAEVARWAEHTRRAWEQRLDRLEAHLDRIAATDSATDRATDQATDQRSNS
jgi:DNA-binding transcriptional ArsR family regulator